MNKNSTYEAYISACQKQAAYCEDLRQAALARGDQAMAEHWEKTARQHYFAAQEMAELTRRH